MSRASQRKLKAARATRGARFGVEFKVGDVVTLREHGNRIGTIVAVSDPGRGVRVHWNNGDEFNIATYALRHTTALHLLAQEAE